MCILWENHYDTMLKGKGRYNVYGSKAVISIPSSIWKDSQYPFKKGEQVDIEVRGNELVIGKSGRRRMGKMKRKIVLVVDDEKDIHALIKTYLSGLNVAVYSAYNGREGIQLYKGLARENKKPDLVIMDLNLSGTRKMEDLMKQIKGEEIDGVRATQEILRIDPDATIVGFSAFAHLEWGERLKATGVKNVFGREIGFEGFAKKVSELLM